jgi:hypothetical protein
MEVGVVFSPRVLLCDPGAELDMGMHRLPEWLVLWKTRLIERFHVQRDEAFPLLVGDLEVAVHVDDVLETKLARETVRPTERLGGVAVQSAECERLAPTQRSATFERSDPSVPNRGAVAMTGR